ncbi:hypothetical protein [Streptomyces sp. NPDC056244]|uniref:hypothetical protein n=1 Tax=unclassified Streptomyces TaxID=2593676 RepID=UPI0035E3BB30
MGWTVLYIAFGIVALWLLGEVLLQYKARLRWRLLAFFGFMGVVLGVLMPSVFVIALGAVAFAVGQTYVTLSFRRGFSTGWAIGGSPGASRRRKDNGRADADRDPALEVTDLEYEPAEAAEVPEPLEPVAASMDSTAVYEPEPLPDDTGQYGVYNDYNGYDATAHDPGGQGRPQQQPDPNGWGGGYDAYPGYQQQPADQGGYAEQGSYAAHDAYQGQDAYHPGHSGEHTYASQDPYAGQDVYAQQQYADPYTGQQQYPGYADPYAADPANGGQQYGSYDSFGGQQQYTDPYSGQQYGAETPPGGVWVPQQREAGQAPPMPEDQPHQPGYDPNYGEQYRY